MKLKVCLMGAALLAPMAVSAAPFYCQPIGKFYPEIPACPAPWIDMSPEQQERNRHSVQDQKDAIEARQKAKQDRVEAAARRQAIEDQKRVDAANAAAQAQQEQAMTQETIRQQNLIAKQQQEIDRLKSQPPASQQPKGGDDAPIIETPPAEDSYRTVDENVGCKSHFSDDKKVDYFAEHYKNHWFTWSGEVVRLDKDQVGLKIDPNSFTQDIEITFANPGQGYNLEKGSRITVKFLMTSAGGCFLPYSGENAALVN